jgi:hypothetical protein
MMNLGIISSSIYKSSGTPLALTYNAVNVDISTYETLVRGIAWSTNGLEVYIVGGANEVNWWTLSVAYDLSTASFSGLFDLSSEAGSISGVAISADGTRLFIGCQAFPSSRIMYSYTMSTAYNVTTCSYDSISKDSGIASLKDIWLNSAGTTIWMLRPGDNLYHSTLSTPFDLSTKGALLGGLAHGSDTGGASSFSFSEDGLAVYFVSSADNKLYKYDLTVAYDETTGSYSGSTFDFSTEDTMYGVVVNETNQKVFVTSNVGDKIYEYDYVP